MSTEPLRLCGAIDGKFTCILPYGHDRHYGENPNTGHQWSAAEPVLGKSERASLLAHENLHKEASSWPRWKIVQAFTSERLIANDLRERLRAQEAMQAKYAAMVKQQHEALLKVVNERESELDMMWCKYPCGMPENEAWHDGVREMWKRLEIIKQPAVATLAAYREMGLEK